MYSEKQNSPGQTPQATPATDEGQIGPDQFTAPYSFSGNPRCNPRNLTPTKVLQLQRTIGNRAVRQLLANKGESQTRSVAALQRQHLHQTKALTAAPTLIQRVTKDRAGLVEMTVREFDTHRKAEQMDWANVPNLSEKHRKYMWDIIDWGVSGLAEIKVDDILKESDKDPKTMTYIKQYCEALDGTLGGSPTVQLEAVDTLAEAKKEGEWVGKLTTAMGGQMVKLVVPRTSFLNLIQTPSVAEKFITYYNTRHPIMQTPDGMGVNSFVNLVRDEGADLAAYDSLPEIRNLHKFYKSSLDKLKEDKGKKDKPLTLILYSVYDHNGAFHRHAQVKKVIENTNTRVFLMEDLSLENLKNLTKTQLGTVAAAHGMGGKITQVMLAGHGNSDNMELGGSGTKVAKDKETGQDKVVPEAPLDELGLPVYFGAKVLDDFWTDFFNALFSNMATKGGLQPKILLRACLTNSNQINVDKLKKLLKDEDGLDVDDNRVDPKSPENQTKIKEGIKKYLDKYGSLATVLGEKAKLHGVKVLGANASISAASTGSIREATGELDIVALSDPKVASPKIEYVRHGKEPVGAIKAVIESWARDEDACFAQMQERLDNDLPDEPDEFIIQLIYSTFLSSYKNDILGANAFVESAGVLHGVGQAGAECRAGKLNADPMIQKHKAAFYDALVGLPVEDKAILVIHQDWMQNNPSKRGKFAARLSDGTFNRNNVVDFLDFKLLDTHIPEIFKLPGNERGKILLALIGLIKEERKDCKDYLLSLVVDEKLPKEVKDELRGYSEDDLRESLDLPVEVEQTAPLDLDPMGPKPDKVENVVMVNGVKSDKYYVEPMRSQTMKMTKSTVTDWAKLRKAPDDNSEELSNYYRNKDFIVVGEVKTTKGVATGWYMLRQDNGTVGYMRKKYF